MNAKEARETATKVHVTSSSQYCRILISIKDAAAKGDLSVFFYEPIDEYARKKLIKDGYTIGETSFDRNEYLTKINW